MSFAAMGHILEALSLNVQFTHKAENSLICTLGARKQIAHKALKPLK
jgi:hypothetical protein